MLSEDREDKADQHEPVIPETPPEPSPHGQPQGGDAPGGSPPKRSPDLLEIVYGVFFSPRKTFAELAQSPPLGLSVAVFLVINVISSALMAVSIGTQLATRAFSLAPASFIVAGLVVGVVNWFVVAGVLNLLAEFIGGTGRGRSLFILLPLANLPHLINAPLALLTFTGSRSLEVLLGLAVLIWVAVLYVIAISEVHHISSGQATIALILPVAAILMVIIALVIAFIGMAANILPMIPGGFPLLPRL